MLEFLFLSNFMLVILFHRSETGWYRYNLYLFLCACYVVRLTRFLNECRHWRAGQQM